VVSAVVATQSSNTRALPAAELETAAQKVSPKTRSSPDPVIALNLARRIAGHSGLVVVAGSIFLVGEVRAYLLGEPVDPTPTADPL
jgi:dihydrofolate synthase/folylpolyglutamate synthase